MREPRHTSAFDRIQIDSLRELLNIYAMSERYTGSSTWIQTTTQRTLIEQWLTEEKLLHWGNLPSERKRKAHQDEIDRFDAHGAPQHYTHVSYRGWWAYVPSHKMSTYLSIMAKSLDTSSENDVNEVPWLKRPLYFDIDFGQIHDWETCLRVCRAIQYLLSQMVPPGQPEKYLAMVIAQSDSVKKSNLHVYFPNVFVDIQSHLQLYEIVVWSMPRFVSRAVVAQSWRDNIIDRNVILTSLRVLECIKTQICPCRTSDASHCVGCRDGKIINTTRYHIKTVLNENGTENKPLADFLREPANRLHAVRLTSIWTPQHVKCMPIEWIGGSPLIERYHPTPEQLAKDMKLREDEQDWRHVLQFDKDLVAEFSSDEFRQDYLHARELYVTMRQHHLAKKKQYLEHENDKVLLTRDDGRVNMIEQFIQGCPIKEWMRYTHLSVTNVYYDEKRQQYDVHVRGVGEHYCHNVDRNHNSACIYFQITRSDQSVVQRCRSRKQGTDRKFGPCLSARASMVKLPRVLLSQLFDTTMPNIVKALSTYTAGSSGSSIPTSTSSGNVPVSPFGMPSSLKIPEMDHLNRCAILKRKSSDEPATSVARPSVSNSRSDSNRNPPGMVNHGSGSSSKKRERSKPFSHLLKSGSNAPVNGSRSVIPKSVVVASNAVAIASPLIAQSAVPTLLSVPLSTTSKPRSDNDDPRSGVLSHTPTTSTIPSGLSRPPPIARSRQLSLQETLARQHKIDTT